MKMVTPAGEIVEVTEEQPELLYVTRSSFGLFGIIFEVTFRVRPLPAMARPEHDRYRPADSLPRPDDGQPVHVQHLGLSGGTLRCHAARLFRLFARDYYRRHGYRPNMTHVGYRIARDINAPFSYSYAGNVMTIDPVSTGDPGWEEFLLAYNRFCSEHDGVPLFNQTWGLTRAQVERAFGERLELVRFYQKRFDPTGRLLNPYFAELIG